MSDIIETDICVIGAGSAGLTLAAAAAAFDVPVVLVEKGAMGGDCLNTGCVPSKALIAAARHVAHIREASRFGVHAGTPQIDYVAVRSHVDSVIAAIAPNDSAERFTGLGTEVVRAEGRFVDRRTLEAGGRQIRARRFVIAAGSSPAVPEIEGLPQVPYLTNESLFDLEKLPSHLIVIGGGPIGMEMAQAFRRLGSDVTILEANRVLSHDDPELAAVVRRRLVAEGVVIREGVKVERVARRGRYGVRVHLAAAEGGDDMVDGTQLLLAVGRRPNVEGLGLEEAGVETGPKGIVTNERLRTANRRIYAIGDISGGFQFTHWASYEAGQALRSILFRFGGKVKRELIPWVTYTDPELAHVGLTLAEAQARAKGLKILRWPFSENDRAETERSTEGFVRVLAAKNGKILGADIVGRGAGELIAPWALAVSKGLKVQDMMATVLPYPTLSEAGKRAATSFYVPVPEAAKRAARLLRRFG
ncbi:NAD(P)/FAD-dependent oxidoreductase [Afifella sp. IM 167]|uniref:dihydrolipoyl dehydrogenase family protein n=1 Tax=Afifella sp. IM 167 TaxID=2033586 RepID=UPI001CCEA38D|nr:FAD-dependent oxidoreductase [Afifella sp. IM 167]MBZ8133825.1 dihydrolipoamide dehydrogenase [Afifella sp. IM 167]